MNSPFTFKRLGYVSALKDREAFLRNKNQHGLHQKALKQCMETIVDYYFLAKNNLQDVDHELRQLKRTFNKRLIQFLKYREISWKQKLSYILFRVSPSLFEAISDTKQRYSRQQSRI